MGGHGSSKWTSSPQVAHLNVSGLEGPSRVRPLEWLWEHLVEVLDERQQFRAEFIHRRETAATDDLAHNHPEHDLDLIEPRTVLGRVHEADAAWRRPRPCSTHDAGLPGRKSSSVRCMAPTPRCTPRRIRRRAGRWTPATTCTP